MKISTNGIGNYGLNAFKNVHQPKPVEPPKKEESEPITKEEKDYFLKLYPNNENEIVKHHFYRKSGELSGVAVGSLINKRG